MIDRWLLPGPASVVSAIAGDLLEGHQVALRHDASIDGLRRAVEDVLAARHQSLSLVFDDADLDPATLLLRAAAEHLGASSELAPGIYWVEGVCQTRAGDWLDLVRQLADRARHREPWERPQVAVGLPRGAARCTGLGMIDRDLRPVGWADLEVAARYSCSFRPPDSCPLTARLRAALAVECAAEWLPDMCALDALDHWLNLSDAALGDAGAVVAHAASAEGPPVSAAKAKILLWRTQQSVLLAEIDRERIRLVETEKQRWRVPFSAPGGERRPDRDIEDLEMLEIGHLFAQARLQGLSRQDPLRRWLERLLDARNALSHLQVLESTELRTLLSGLRGRTGGGNSSWTVPA